ncbi:MAG: substrate-binding domain-containing protein [Kiritimatiellae bacterium]|nr:substrate-binding domain-containing protein [Kiritimatiellia bacterium]
MTERGKDTKKRVVIALQMAGKPGQRKMSGILDYLAEKDLRWEIRFVRHREDFSPDFIRALASNPVDGILYSFDTVPTVEAELAKIDMPTVGLDVFDQSPLCGRTRNLALVTGDCTAVGRAAADLLLDSGTLRRFAFVPDMHHRTWGKLRGRAFLDHLKVHGFSADTYRRPRGAANDVAELATWLKERPKPCGVFVAFDDRALDVMEACRMAGIHVPHDVAVISVDNDEMLCEHTVPALTSIQPDHLAMGRRAAELLCGMMEGHATTTVHRESCGIRQVAVRESTPKVSNAGRLVQRAVAYIQSHATKGIGVRDVVAHLKCSRRLADLRFRELQGMSILETIRKVQMDEVCRLLRTTNLSVAAIAAQTGFASAKHLPERFKAAFGCSMGAYRT